MKESYIAKILNGAVLCVFWGYNLSSATKFCLFILMFVMLIIKTSSKKALKYCFVAMKNLVLLSSHQNFSQIILQHCYQQSRKGKK